MLLWSVHQLQFAAGADNSTVRGLVVNRWFSNGIEVLTGADNCVFEGNFIGTDATGTAALGNNLGLGHGLIDFGGAGTVFAVAAGITLAAVQLLHAATFAATHLAAMHYITRTTPPRLAASMQSLYSALSGGLVMGGTMLLAGSLYESGPGLPFLAMAGLLARSMPDRRSLTAAVAAAAVTATYLLRLPMRGSSGYRRCGGRGEGRDEPTISREFRGSLRSG